MYAFVLSTGSFSSELSAAAGVAVCADAVVAASAGSRKPRSLREYFFMAKHYTPVDSRHPPQEGRGLRMFDIVRTQDIASISLEAHLWGRSMKTIGSWLFVSLA